VRRDGITEKALNLFRRSLNQEKISGDELFNYVYGILHSPDYKERFGNNLTKSLPRIPIPKDMNFFRIMSDAGLFLVNLHLEIHSPELFPVLVECRSVPLTDQEKFHVQKMRFAGTRGREDKTTVIYNEHITIKNIPLEAYEYVVNGKPALEWVMERQCVKVDKDSGIVNDANDYAIETMNNPAYPLELFQRVITVSLETMKIVKSLPPLD